MRTIRRDICKTSWDLVWFGFTDCLTELTQDIVYRQSVSDIEEFKRCVRSIGKNTVILESFVTEQILRAYRDIKLKSVEEVGNYGF